MSVGTAAVLGLADLAVAVPPTTAYLMVGGRCSNNCAFCAQAHSSTASEELLSRVAWPRHELKRVIDRIGECQDSFERVCIQATASLGAYRETLKALQQLVERVDIPVDASILPPSFEAAEELFEAGLDHLGFGIDAASEPIFTAVKNNSWHHYRHLIAAAAASYPDKVAVHLIVGVGESEREMVAAMQEYCDLGVNVGLFAFCPVKGTKLQSRKPPDISSYRRVQMARYLIFVKGVREPDFLFTSDGVIAGFKRDPDLQALLDGKAFETSGCPGCNRPFYNERPSGPLYNYPRHLTEEEFRKALLETELPELKELVKGLLRE